MEIDGKSPKISPRSKKITLPTIVLILLFALPATSFTQSLEGLVNSRHKLGVVLGHGGKQMPWSELDIAYDYQVNIMQLQYLYAVKSGKTFGFDLLLSPQYNKTSYRKVDQIGDLYNGYEVGVTAGFSPRLYTYDRAFGFYLLLSTGPLYISGTPGRQAEGINFSSTAATGVQIRLEKRTFVDFRTGFRHLSNARMKEPNGGVNNLVWSVGLSYAL